MLDRPDDKDKCLRPPSLWIWWLCPDKMICCPNVTSQTSNILLVGILFHSVVLSLFLRTFVASCMSLTILTSSQPYPEVNWRILLVQLSQPTLSHRLPRWVQHTLVHLSSRLSLKWYPISLYSALLVFPVGLWSKVVHYVGHRVPFVTPS